MISKLSLLLLLASVGAIPIDYFFPFNGEKVCLVDDVTGLIHTSNVLDCYGRAYSDIDPSECNEFRLNPNDDGSSHEMSLSVTFPFFGKRFQNVYINTNGVISFTAAIPTFTPEPFPISDRFLIAPFWADVDTRGTGEVLFKETTNMTLLVLAKNVIRRATNQVAGLSRFTPRWMLIATWYQVGYYNSHADLANTFQAVLVTDGRFSFVIFNYLDDGVNWNKGDASTVPAQVGFNYGGDGLHTLTLPDSGMENITEIDTASNVNIAGQFVFRIDDVYSPSGCSNTAEILEADPNTPSIIGGGTMLLTGPCFSVNIEKIHCLFTDKDGDVTSFTNPDGTITKRVISGITVNEKAVCPLPLFRMLGSHNVTITLNNGRNYTGNFEVVPSVYKEPDVLIIDKNQTQFELIDYNTVYNGKWNAYELNNNDFQESGETKFFIENWLFQKHARTKVSRWIPRHEFAVAVIRISFHVLQTDDNNGFFSFKQITSAPVRFQFPISIIVVRKQTQNLNITYTSSLLSFLPDRLGLSGKNAIKHWCNKWHASTNENINPDYLESCPCTLEFAKFDPDLSEDFTCSPVEPGCHENINAYRCYLKRINGSHMGQQCCYDGAGEYARDNIAAGSADFYFPFDHYLLHQSSDYFPYKACCVDSNDNTFCDLYYQKRPKANATCYPTKTIRGNAGGGGDKRSISQQFARYKRQSSAENLQSAFIPYNQGKVCMIDTSTRFVYSNSSNKSGKFELLDGTNCTEYKLSPNNDGSSGAIPISVPFPMFGLTYYRIFVNTNGVISFKRPLNLFTLTSFPVDNEDVIAPYWTDIDITYTGNVFFKESTENEILDEITNEIRNVNLRLADFKALWAFIVTWDHVVQNSNFNNNQKPVTFQAILTTNGRKSFALFYYENKEMLDEMAISNNNSCVRTKVGYNVGKHYNTYRTNSAGKNLNSLNSLKLISRCQKNKILIELDNKGVDNNSGCNTKGSLIVDKKFIPITGGGAIKINGACFLLQDVKVICKFEHATTIGRIISSDSALCPLPLFTRLGQHLLWLSEDNGITFNFHAVINIVPAIYSKPDVMITDENGVEIIYGVLIPNKQYNISVRDQVWDENYEILHMTYHSRTNTWIKSPIKLKRQFQRKIIDQQRVTPMLISVIQVVKEINKTKIAYSSSVFTLSHQDDMRKMCQNWIKQDRRITKNLNNFFPCPCTLKEAEIDPNYEYDIMCTLQETHPFWDSLNCQTKKAAYGCFISKPMMYNGASQQCCYDNNGALLINSPGRGTIHKTAVHANDYFNYFENDHFPYLVCCPQNCDEYYKRRASDNCYNYVSYINDVE